MIEFVEQVGGDVSRGGIFVKTKRPLEPGALLKFEFQLQTGEPMIYGVGRVAWRRTEEGSRPNLPAGMGIKFIKLNGMSRSVIDRIESKHGPGSRFDLTDGAEVASSLSSLPPSGLSHAPELAASVPPSATLITPLRPEAMRAVAEASRSTGASLDELERPTRSSPPLKEARASGPKPGPLPATFRPPPPATDSVPPPHSSNPPASPAMRPGSSGQHRQVAASAAVSGAPGLRKSSGAPGGRKPSGAYSQTGLQAESLGGSLAPRGALSSSAPARRPSSSRSAARDTSEFLASAFSVGGAGREVRSEAQSQAERARHDPRSVDLANELFGDLNAAGVKPDAALDADPMLQHLAPTTPPPDLRATTRLSPGPLPAHVPDPDIELPGAAPPRGEPKPAPRLRASGPAAANDQLSLKLGRAGASVANETTLRPSRGSGRALWIAAIGILGAAVGAAAYYLQLDRPVSVVGHGADTPPVAAPEPVQPTAAPAPAEPEPVLVELSVSSQPAGAEVKVDGTAAGNTPVTLKLAQGKAVTLTVRAPGYATHAERVDVVTDLPARNVTLQPLPYELVVTEPEGATVKALNKNVEAPAPLNLGVLYPPDRPAAGPKDLTVVIEKSGFQRATRKLTRDDFQEEATAMRATLSVPLVQTKAAAAAAAAKPPAAAPAAAPTAPPPAALKITPVEPSAPPEPETAAPSAAPAPAPTPPTPAPEKPKAEAAPAPAEPPPAEPAPPPPPKKPTVDIPDDL